MQRICSGGERVGHEARESRRISTLEWSVHWSNISGALDRIPQYWADYWTKEFINEAVITERWQAWGFGSEEGELNVIVLTQIIDFPANRFLQVVLAFGNSLDSCLATIEATMERFAIETKCDICEIVGRYGWERKLPRFRRTGVVLRAKVPRIGVH